MTNYSGTLEMEKTSVLICSSPSGDKYSHAKKWKIPCVTSSWVLESIERGYCLPTDQYRVDRIKTKSSTPTKIDQTRAELSEVSMCSTILNPDETMAARSIEDTINSTAAIGGDAGALAAVIKGKTTSDWLAELDLTRVKKAGAFLDGCRIYLSGNRQLNRQSQFSINYFDQSQFSLYLSGFTDPEQVQLARVLKFGGGVRLTQLVESVSHVVHSIDKPDLAPEVTRVLTQIPDLTPHMVSVQWLVESMRLGRPAAETEYPFPLVHDDHSRLQPPTTPLQQNTCAPAGQTTPAETTTQFEKRLMAQYGSRDKPDTNTLGLTATEDLSSIAPFMAGLKVNLAGFDEETMQDYTDWIGEAGGEIPYTDYDGPLDYFITPPDSKIRPKHECHNIVNGYWLDDCLDDGSLLPVSWHHQVVRDYGREGPCSGVVTCLSGYAGRERMFINTLVNQLGGTAQELFAKKENKSKNTAASTHLILQEAEGQKYQAAVKWQLPAVTVHWLLACLRDETHVSEQQFLVGESRAVTPGRPDPSPEVKNEDANTGNNDDQTVIKDITIVEADLNDDNQDVTMKEDDDDYGDKTMEEVTFNSKEKQGMDISPSAAAALTPAARLKQSAVTTPGPAAVDTPTLERLRPKPIDVSNITVTPQRYPESQPSPSSQRYHSNTGVDRDQDMPTPDTPYGAHWSRDPSPRTRKYYKKVLEKLPRPELTEIEVNQMQRFRNQDSLEMIRNKNSKNAVVKELYDQVTNHEKVKADHEKFLDQLESKGVPVVSRDKRSFEEIMEEKYQKMGMSWKNIGDHVSKKARLELDSSVRNQDDQGVSKVLDGVVLVVSKKLQSEAAELHQVVQSLGGTISWTLTSDATHFVFFGRQNDLTKDYRKAKELKCHVVAPDWVFMCRDAGERISESTFPHTYKPKMKLDITHDSSNMITPRLVNKTKISAKPRLLPTSDEKPAVVDETRAPSSDEKEPRVDDTRLDDTAAPDSLDTMKVAEAVSNQMQEINDLLHSATTTPASVKTDQRRAAPRVSLNLLDDNYTNSPTQDKKPVLDLVSDVKPESDSQIGWRDENDEVEHKKITEEFKQLETESLGELKAMGDMPEQRNKDSTRMESSMGGSFNVNNLTEMEMEARRKHEAGVAKVFLVSCWSDKDPNVFEACNKLGRACLSTSSNYDKSVTHMLATKVSRSEKMLASVAAGKWILHPSYVRDSVKAGHWLEEDKYEWGDARNQFIQDKNSQEWKIAAAARKWRMDEGQCLEGCKFILHMPVQKIGAFSRSVKHS